MARPPPGPVGAQLQRRRADGPPARARPRAAAGAVQQGLAAHEPRALLVQAAPEERRMSDDQAGEDATFAAFMAQHYSLGPNGERVIAPLPYDNTPVPGPTPVAQPEQPLSEDEARNVDAFVRRHFPARFS